MSTPTRDYYSDMISTVCKIYRSRSAIHGSHRSIDCAQHIYYDQSEKLWRKNEIIFFPALRFHGNGAHLGFHGSSQGTYNFKPACSNALKSCTYHGMFISLHGNVNRSKLIRTNCLKSDQHPPLTTIIDLGE